jgi:voltage-gated potassium channel
MQKANTKFNLSQFDRFTPVLNQLLHFVIIINIIVICLETLEELKAYFHLFETIELVSVIVFSIEYLIRLIWSYKYHKVSKYALSVIGIIDLLSILPFYFPLLLGFNLSFFKVLRLFRLLRIFKLYRYSDHLQTVIEVIKHKLEYLWALLFATGIVVLFCSVATYYFEHEAQPSLFKSVFSSLWWAVSTVMTIGYGDMIPITVGGKIMATILGFVGISLLAVLAGIFSAGFVEIVEKKKINTSSRKDHFRNSRDDER